MSHFDEMSAFLYLEGQLDSVQAAEVQTHLKECTECRALLGALDRESKWLCESLTEKDPVPARFAAPARSASLPWGWITALGMAAGGILTVWNEFVEPFQQQLNQAGFSGGNLMTMLFFSGAFWKGWASVLSFFEFCTAAVFGVLMLVLLQRFWKRSATLGAVLAAFALLFFVGPQTAHAAEVFHGTPNQPSYVLPAGQTLNNDLIVFAEATRIDGTVDGDVIAWSNTVEVTGHVTGDVLSMSNHVRITGQVDGNVRVMSGAVFISGKVGKNVMAWTGEVELTHDAQVGGSLTSFTGEALISGHVTRDFMGFDGDTTIDGSVGGDTELTGGQLTIGSGAEITGSTRFHGDHPPIVATGAKLGSPVEFTQRSHAPNYRSGRYYWHRAEFWGAAFLFGLVVILMLPGFFAEGMRASEKFLPSLGLGTVALVATPIVAVIVCATVIGLGVGITTLLIYLIAVYASQMLVGTWLGKLILGPGDATGALLGRLALGLLIIHALELLPMHIGFLVKLVVILWGLGAIVMACYRNMRKTAVTPA